MYASWYVVAWRLLWFVPFHLAALLFVSLVFIVYGVDTAVEKWDSCRMH